MGMGVSTRITKNHKHRQFKPLQHVVLTHPFTGKWITTTEVCLPVRGNPTVASPAAGHHRRFTGTKLYCLVTEAHVCEQLAQGCYLKVERPTFEPVTF